MKRTKFYAVALGLMLAGTISAQKWSVGKDLSYLKGQTAICLKYTYDNLITADKKPEATYVKEKVEKLNKKESGKGDAWAKSWVDNRAAKDEPKFELLFNKAAETIQGTKDKAGTKYTIIVHCTKIDPGYNIGVSHKPAVCDFEFTIVESANPTKVLSKGVLPKMATPFGLGFDFMAIEECFAKAGKKLGKSIGKAIK